MFVNPSDTTTSDNTKPTITMSGTRRYSTLSELLCSLDLVGMNEDLRLEGSNHRNCPGCHEPYSLNSLEFGKRVEYPVRRCCGVNELSTENGVVGWTNHQQDSLWQHIWWFFVQKPVVFTIWSLFSLAGALGVLTTMAEVFTIYLPVFLAYIWAEVFTIWLPVLLAYVWAVAEVFTIPWPVFIAGLWGIVITSLFLLAGVWRRLTEKEKPVLCTIWVLFFLTGVWGVPTATAEMFTIWSPVFLAAVWDVAEVFTILWLLFIRMLVWPVVIVFTISLLFFLVDVSGIITEEG